ncbi:MAG: TonB-dependent receptor plug domain-containing protein [Steroidobacteraceae bacterium]
MKTHPLVPVTSLGMFAVCMIAMFPVRADTGSSGVNRLRGLTIEQLMNVEVTSVARHPEKLLRAASAIQVITQEDIRRSGATSIAEVLRLADNLEVAQTNSHDWAISARGFNTALANKLLVLIDGRTVYTPLFSGVFWDVQDYLLEDIDRIEVISGPGGTLWGANAVNGVINIITKSAKDTQGAYAEGGAGNQLDALGGVRYGGTISPNTSYRVYAKYVDRDAQMMTDGAPGSDAWHQGRGGFRIDSDPTSRDALTLQGDFYSGHEDEPSGGAAATSGGNLLGRWSRRFSQDSDMSVLSYIDRTHLLDPQPALTLGPLQLAPAGALEDDLTTYDIELQDRFGAGTYHRIVWGVGFRRTHDDVSDAPGLAFLPNVLDQNLYDIFVQDEMPLARNLSFVLGTKLERNDYTGWEWQPDLRLQWTFASEESLWGAVSRAVRTPSRVDRDLYEAAPPGPQLLQGGADFRSESVIAYELGYRGQIGARFSSSVSTFYNDYDDLRSTSFTPQTVLPLYFANALEGDTYGLEFSGNFQALPGWSLHAGYTLLMEHLRVKPGQVDINDALNETADPRHQFSLRSAIELPRHVQFDAALRWVDTLHTNNGPTPGTVPAYFELDSRIAWQASTHIELSLDGRNLVHSYHPEYGFPGPSRIEIARSVYAKLTWHGG